MAPPKGAPAGDDTFAVKVITVPAVGEAEDDETTVVVALVLTMTATDGDVLAAKIACVYDKPESVKPCCVNPSYVALRECVPDESSALSKYALPLASTDAAPIELAPSRKVKSPPGTAGVLETWASSRTVWLARMVVGVAVSVVLVE